MKFTADIDYDGDCLKTKNGLAVKWAFKNGDNLWDADLLVLQLNSIWTAHITSTHTRIGCQRHNNEDWFKFSDDKIQDMGANALEYWKEAKPMIELAVKTLKARKG